MKKWHMCLDCCRVRYGDLAKNHPDWSNRKIAQELNVSVDFLFKSMSKLPVDCKGDHGGEE